MYSGVSAKMVKITYTKVPADVCKKNRTFYKNHVRKAFVMWLAYEGYFDGVFTKSEICKAKKGTLPSDCNIHHKVPLSGCNDLMVNDFCNLTVLHKNTHEFINKYIFSPQLKPIQTAPFGTEIVIDVPNYSYVDVDGIKKERALAKCSFLSRNNRER